MNLQLRLGQLTELIVFTIILAAFWNYSNRSILIPWFFFSVLSCIFRFTITFYTAKKIILIDQNVKKLSALLKLSAFLAGSSWGFVGSLLLPAQDFSHELFGFFLLVGTIAAATLFYSGVKNTYIYFIAPAYIPHIAWLIIQGPAYYPIAACALIYFFMMMGLSIYINRFVTTSVSLQYANKDLIEDLSNAKKQLEFFNDKLKKEVEEDHLTGLFNRKALYSKLNNLLKAAAYNSQRVAVLYCDIDHFKQINDKLGHDTGDALLVKMAKCLQAAVSPADIVARIGGDEFVIVLDNIQDTAYAALRVEEIIESVHGNKIIKGHKIDLRISIGVSIYPENGLTKKALLKSADLALYKAKVNGRDQFMLNNEIKSH